MASGDGSIQVNRATQWLEHNYSSYVSAKGVDSPGPLGLVVLAAVAAGADPTRFGGEASANDLVARLVATEHLDGASAGLSVRKLSERVLPVPCTSRVVALKGPSNAISLGEAYLADRQCTGGGWDTRSPRRAPGEPENLCRSRHELDCACRHGDRRRRWPVRPSPQAFFTSSQETDGSFGYYGVSGDGQHGDPDSTA